MGGVLATTRENRITIANLAIEQDKLFISSAKKGKPNSELRAEIEVRQSRVYKNQRIVNLAENGHKVSHPFCSLKFDLDRQYGVKTEQLYEGKLWTNFARPYRNKRSFYLLKDLPYKIRTKGNIDKVYTTGEIIGDKVILECIKRFYKLADFKELKTIEKCIWGEDIRHTEDLRIDHILFRNQKNQLYCKAIPIRRMVNCLMAISKPTKRKGEYITEDGFIWRIKHKDFYHLYDWIQERMTDINAIGYVDAYIGFSRYEKYYLSKNG